MAGESDPRAVFPSEPERRAPQLYRLKGTWEPGQRDGERSRLIVDGRTADDNDLCTVVVVHEIGGGWAIFPHGGTRFGVRLSRSDALSVARRILDEAQ
ncbi:MAG: hypothetical protein ACRDRV_19460 [Pseudonocardiaceae bacterium]